MTDQEFKKTLDKLIEDVFVPALKEKALSLWKSGAINQDDQYSIDDFLPAKACVFVAAKTVRKSLKPVSIEGDEAINNLQYF